MGIYKTKFNPFSKSLQWVLKGTLITFKESVSTYNNLPITGNSQNEARITDDTGHLYVWGIEESSGELSDWIDQGDVIDIQWDSIDGKPSSTPTNIDDAVDKKHTQGTDTTLNPLTADLDMNDHSITNLKDDSIGFKSGGTINRADYLDSISKKHEQNTDTKLAEGTINEVTASELIKNISNTILLAFQVAVLSSFTIYEMIDGFVDTYLDESGIDTVNSINQLYNAIGHYYEATSLSEDIKLLLHCNGADESTTFTDSSPSEHTVTAVGNAQIDTAQYKFGGASGLFDGTGDYLTIPDSADWDFYTNNSLCHTIDMWVRLPDVDTRYMIFCQTTNASNTSYLCTQTDGAIQFNLLVGGVSKVSAVSATGLLSPNTWHHVCQVILGTGSTKTYATYVDGVQVLYATDNTNTTFSNSFNIGRRDVDSASYFKGNIDEFRIKKSNAFGASPNIGLTDTIIVPTSEYTVGSENMTLISNTQSADIEPLKARIVISEEDVDEIILNTDIKAYISRDDGSTWGEVIWVIEEVYGGTERIFVGSVNLSISGIGSGTDMRYKIETLNYKKLKVHSTALLWD